MNSSQVISITGKSLQQFLNYHLDRVTRPNIKLWGQNWNAYLFWQVIGVVMGVTVVMVLTVIRDLSLGAMTLLLILAVVIAILIFKSMELFGQFVPKVEIFGKPLPMMFIWAASGIYHYQIAILTSAASVVYLLKEPLLPYLDLLAIGLCVGQVNGRIGCFMAGCCHGRPFSIGGLYGEEHAQAGYINYLQGVRLFPAQLLESGWLLFMSVISIIWTLQGSLPGEVLSWYIIAYGFGRFFFEFLRADSIRLYLFGFSESQWVALFMMALIVILELTTSMEFRWWHTAATIFLFLVVIIVSVLKHYQKLERFELFHPHHLREFAEIINWFSDLVRDGITFEGNLQATTSRQVCLSATAIYGEHEHCFQYSISYQDMRMKAEIGTSLAGLISQLRHSSESFELVESEPGVFTVSFHSAQASEHLGKAR